MLILKSFNVSTLTSQRLEKVRGTELPKALGRSDSLLLTAFLCIKKSAVY